MKLLALSLVVLPFSLYPTPAAQRKRFRPMNSDPATGARPGIKPKGKAYTIRSRYMDTWVKRNGMWQCAASQSTLLPGK